MEEDYLEKATESWKEILEDKNFFENMILTELNKKIVGELETRKVICLCAFGGRLVENSQTASFNLMINDDAGTGKDYITAASLELLPKQNYIKKTRISPTVLNYWHNSKDEPQWTWDGKVLYLEDISEGILNHDVFKVMCSGGSSATIVKDQKVVNLEVKGKPVMIITTASAIPNAELVRRFGILNLNSSVSQTEEIMKRHCEFRTRGIIPIVNPIYSNAMQLLKQVSVAIPFADTIYKHFPSKHVIMRTHFPRFLDYISAAAALHQLQREKNEEGFIIAEGQDYDLARECFLTLCSNKYMIPLTINQRKILEHFEKDINLEGSAASLHATKLNFISDRALATNLGILTRYGILETFEELNAQNKTVTNYRLAVSYHPNEEITLPTYEELCRIASTPSRPSIPSIASIPSIPTKKDNNNKVFLEVPKVPKVFPAVSDTKRREIERVFS